MHTIRNALAAILLLPCILAAAPPIDWPADLASREVRNLYARHGDAVDIALRLTLRGQPYAPAEAVCRYQTNGMGRAWWEAPVALSSNIATVAWGPALDPGADLVSLLVELDGAHRAAALLHLRPGPSGGSALPPPTAVLDFAAVAWTNAPWADLAAVSNAVAGITAATVPVSGIYGQDNVQGVLSMMHQFLGSLPPPSDMLTADLEGTVSRSGAAVPSLSLGGHAVATDETLLGYAATNHAHASLASGAARLDLGTNGAASVSAPADVISQAALQWGENGGLAIVLFDDPAERRPLAELARGVPSTRFRLALYSQSDGVSTGWAPCEASLVYTASYGAGYRISSPSNFCDGAFAEIGPDEFHAVFGLALDPDNASPQTDLHTVRAAPSRALLREGDVDASSVVLRRATLALGGGTVADALDNIAGTLLPAKLDKASVTAEAWTLTLTNGVVTNVWVWTGEAPQ